MLRQIGWWIRKGPIRKNRVLLVTTLFFLKILFQFKNLLERVDLMYQQPTQISIFLLFVSAGVLFDGAFFHVSILNHMGFVLPCSEVIYELSTNHLSLSLMQRLQSSKIFSTSVWVKIFIVRRKNEAENLKQNIIWKITFSFLKMSGNEDDQAGTQRPEDFLNGPI